MAMSDIATRLNFSAWSFHACAFRGPRRLVIVTIYWYNGKKETRKSHEQKEKPMSGSFSVGEHFEQFIKNQVASGRYNNESEVVRDALRLAELRELKLQALREHLAQALQRGGSYTDEEIAAILEADEEEEE